MLKEVQYVSLRKKLSQEINPDPLDCRILIYIISISIHVLSSWKLKRIYNEFVVMRFYVYNLKVTAV